MRRLNALKIFSLNACRFTNNIYFVERTIIYCIYIHFFYEEIFIIYLCCFFGGLLYEKPY